MIYRMVLSTLLACDWYPVPYYIQNSVPTNISLNLLQKICIDPLIEQSNNILHMLIYVVDVTDGLANSDTR